MKYAVGSWVHVPEGYGMAQVEQRWTVGYRDMQLICRTPGGDLVGVLAKDVEPAEPVAQRFKPWLVWKDGVRFDA